MSKSKARHDRKYIQTSGYEGEHAGGMLTVSVFRRLGLYNEARDVLAHCRQLRLEVELGSKDRSFAYSLLPIGAKWSCSFGFSGEGGFSEYWSHNGCTYRISNGSWCGPVRWTLRLVAKRV